MSPQVSIPFIAGQWSLLSASAISWRTTPTVSIPFIAGQWSLRPTLNGFARIWKVSIPFIAGQWSLHGCSASASPSATAFQSPSLRGSGRFPGRGAGHGVHPAEFQSPSLRGSGRFSGTGTSASGCASSFNPLHCGAVVASRISPPSREGGGRFNPLHCGAVVASRLRRGRRRPSLIVSIPFIAGQWSLQTGSSRFGP